jgi:CheY-like chemotaxis protein
MNAVRKKKERILIVDDNADFLEVMKDGLAVSGRMITATTSGKELFENLPRLPYDAALLI